jgi:hypothetical protein
VNGPHLIFSAFSATEVTETTEQKLECRNNGLDILFFLPIVPIFHYSINLFIFLCALCVLCGGNSSVEAWKRNLYSLGAVEFLSVLGMAWVPPFLPFYVRELGITEQQDVKRWSGFIYAAPLKGARRYRTVCQGRGWRGAWLGAQARRYRGKQAKCCILKQSLHSTPKLPTCSNDD